MAKARPAMTSTPSTISGAGLRLARAAPSGGVGVSLTSCLLLRRAGGDGGGPGGAGGDRHDGGVLRRVPPAAAERAEQRGDVGEALRIGLHLAEGGVLVLLLHRQHLQLVELAGAVLRQ